MWFAGHQINWRRICGMGLDNSGRPTMSVSIRHIAAVAILTAMSSTAAQAGCCGNGGNNGVTNIPTVQGPAGGCCGPLTNHVVGVPGVFVPAPNVNIVAGGPNIGGTNISVGGPTFNNTSNTFGGGSSGGNVFIGGGGGYMSSPSPTAPGFIEALNVGGGQQAVSEQFQESRSVTETMAIRAVCMDDRGMPHPASRTDGDQAIAATFNGEVFRCMAGTRMEVTMGKVVNGQPVFDGGRTMSCAKGQALAYSTAPGANGANGAAGAGNLVCVAQAARAECNERSLLRRFGPGIKFATVTRTETITSTRQASNQVTLRSSMFVDGGVGQGVY
jgi:hypothetical protein